MFEPRLDCFVVLFTRANGLISKDKLLTLSDLKQIYYLILVPKLHSTLARMYNKFITFGSKNISFSNKFVIYKS